MPKNRLIRLSLLIEHRLLTDRQTDTDTGPWLVPALAQRRTGKNYGTRVELCPKLVVNFGLSGLRELLHAWHASIVAKCCQLRSTKVHA